MNKITFDQVEEIIDLLKHKISPIVHYRYLYRVLNESIVNPKWWKRQIKHYDNIIASLDSDSVEFVDREQLAEVLCELFNADDEESRFIKNAVLEFNGEWLVDYIKARLAAEELSL